MLYVIEVMTVSAVMLWLSAQTVPYAKQHIPTAHYCNIAKLTHSNFTTGRNPES
jgi:hypothetical protein